MLQSNSRTSSEANKQNFKLILQKILTRLPHGSIWELYVEPDIIGCNPKCSSFAVVFTASSTINVSISHLRGSRKHFHMETLPHQESHWLTTNSKLKKRVL